LNIEHIDNFIVTTYLIINLRTMLHVFTDASVNYNYGTSVGCYCIYYGDINMMYPNKHNVLTHMYSAFIYTDCSEVAELTTIKLALELVDSLMIPNKQIILYTDLGNIKNLLYRDENQLTASRRFHKYLPLVYYFKVYNIRVEIMKGHLAPKYRVTTAQKIFAIVDFCTRSVSKSLNKQKNYRALISVIR
jgi:hypothetical protein